MLDSSLRTILEVANREVDLEAVAAKLGRPLENRARYITLRDRVAIVDVIGPLFRYANLFTEISGATSLEVLATELNAAVENPNVDAILLNVDSPGGEANGVNEFAAMVRDARKKKTVCAYVGGMAASGSYWIASAAGKIFADESAFIGSIGVVARFRDNRSAESRQGAQTIEIVSSQSPNKRVDPATDEGRSHIQQRVDDLAQIFVEAVASNRGTTAEKVLADFGQGGVMIASKAIEAGMVDGLSSFESVLAHLSATGRASGFAAAIAASSKEVVMENDHQAVQVVAPATEPEPAAAAPATADEGAIRAAERSRIAAILTCGEAAGRTSLAMHLALETEMDAEGALKVLAAALTAKESTSSFVDVMAGVKNPVVGVDDDSGNDDAQAEIRKILAFAPRK
jgi:capsid assembly protease